MQKQFSEGFFKKDVMRNFAEFAGKNLYQNLCINLCLDCELLKRAAQVKEQVSEAVVHSLQIRCS